MPSVCMLVIQECDSGIAIDQIPIERGTELERMCAGVLDVGLRLSQEALMRELSSHGDSTARAIEGENIEKYISEGLKNAGAVNFREALVKAGFQIKGKNNDH